MTMKSRISARTFTTTRAWRRGYHRHLPCGAFTSRSALAAVAGTCSERIPSRCACVLSLCRIATRLQARYACLSEERVPSLLLLRRRLLLLPGRIAGRIALHHSTRDGASRNRVDGIAAEYRGSRGGRLGFC